MSTVTAVIGDPNSVGSRMFTAGLDPRSNIASNQNRRNPDLAAARIRTIVAPHTIQDALGGFISADFTIPAEEALRWRPLLRYGAVCWLFDGGTPIFHGYLEQPVWTQYGDCQVTVAGAWSLLGTSRKREAWDMWDMSLLQHGGSPGGVENRGGQVNQNGDGTLTLSFASGTVLAASDRCSVTYLLFGETVFGNDDKLITAFEVNISDQQNLGANMRFRVIGATTATATGDTLWDSGATTGTTAVQGALNLAGTNQSGAWPVDGYRCLRLELVRITSGITLGNDTSVTFSRIRISTRENLFVAGGSTMDSGTIARDVLTVGNGAGTGIGAVDTSVQTDLPPEVWPSSVVHTGSDSNTSPYTYGLDPRIPLSSAPNSGVGITGFTALEWQSPADILSALAAIDGNHCGFYIPYNGRGGYDAPGWQSSGGTFGADVGSSWLAAAPQLTYQAFTDPVTNPDYTIQTRQGAVVEPQADAQPLDDMMYVNYQTRRGNQQSVVQTDADTRNYAYAQGFRRADDYTIQPAVGDSKLASSLGQQQLVPRRNPLASATITIEKTGATSNAILKQGALITRLASIRPGSVHITDMNASSSLRKGVITHVEWWGQTLTSNEKVVLSLAEPPGRPHKRRAAGHLVNRMQHTRSGILLH